MRVLCLDLPPGRKAVYLKIADAVRSAIREQRLKPGERLPSSRKLAESLDVHRQTVVQAFEELLAEGWIASQQRRFYRVSERLPSEFFRSRLARPEGITRSSIPWRIVRRGDEQLDLPPAAIRYAFHSALPDLREFPYGEFKSHWVDALKSSRSKIRGTGNPAGHPRFLEALALYLRRARSLTGRRLMVTHGSQEAIHLAAQLLLKPGDRVAVESPGYAPAWGAFRLAGAGLLPIQVDRHGLDPSDLEKKLRAPSGRSIRLIYVTPLHQFPTTVALPIDRRLRLYELAAKHGVPILEDDYDHEYHYRSQPLAPLASQDPASAVIYVSGFSKVLFPTARLGFLAVPGTIEKQLIGLKRVTTRENDQLFQEAVARWIETGGFERHLRRMRRTYLERRDVMVESLEKAQAAGIDLSWRSPDGGMALWLRTAHPSDQVFWKARSQGIHVLPEAALRVDGKPGTGIRLGYAGQTPAEIRRGISELAEVCSSL